MLRIYSQSLGCPKNRVDTERLLGSLGKPSLGEPVLTVSEPEEADLVFINTCAFIGPAVEESVRTIVQMAADLEDLPERPFFVVGGCLPGRYGVAELAGEIPEVDLWLHAADVDAWPAMLADALKLKNAEPGRLLSTGPSYAWLKIGEGCRHRCSFCTIPSIRGPHVSAPAEALETEARALLEQAGWQQLEGQPWRQKAGQPLAIELAFIGTDALAKSMAEIIQANLRQVGVQVTLVGEEESSIYARQREGRFGMIFNRTWGAPYDPHAFLSSMRVPSHADYQAQRGLPDKALIDKEISEVLTTGDEAQRRKLYHDVLTRLHQDAVYLPISYVSLMSVARQEVGEIPFAPVTSEIPFDQITPVTP